MVEVVAIEPESEGQPKVFQRLYVSLSGLRKRFLQGRRPVLCVDGCFLKRFLGGQLLVAVGRDGNNQMFPMCWAVVEGENNDSWHWFLSNIKKDLEGFQVKGATIVSDQHQSIVAAIASLFPNVEHRLCSRHIYAKWKKAHKGDAYKDAFYKVVKAHNMASYELALEELKVLSTEAALDFVKEGPKRFCRTFMRTTSKCNLVVNNLAKTFNGYIIESRSKPIIDMLEEIRVQLMGRLFNKKRWMMKQDDDICPRIRKKLEKNKEYARKCTVVASIDRLFQVYDNTDMLVVNLQEQTCSCKWWDHCGILCYHAVACCNWMRIESEIYVHKWLTKNYYMTTYLEGIRPIQGEAYWEKVDYPLQPPPIKIGSVRPKKNRRKNPTEREAGGQKKRSKHGVVMVCSLCKQKFHNKRSCPQKGKQIQQTSSAPKAQERKCGTGKGTSSVAEQEPKKSSKKTSTSSQPTQTVRKGRWRPRKKTNTILHEHV